MDTYEKKNFCIETDKWWLTRNTFLAINKIKMKSAADILLIPDVVKKLTRSSLRLVIKYWKS